MSIKKITKAGVSIMKSLMLTAVILAGLTSILPATETKVVSPFSSVEVSAGLIDDINLLGYKCLFPGDGSRDGTCAGGGKALFSEVEQWLFSIAGFVAVLVIVWGGYRYFIGTIAEDKEQGKKTIRAGVIGLVFVMVAGIIRDLIQGTFQDNGSGQVEFSATAVATVIKDFLAVFIPLAAVTAVAFLVYGGFLLITASGNDEKNKKGMDAIKNSVIGLIVVLLASTIVQVVNVAIKAASGS